MQQPSGTRDSEGMASKGEYLNWDKVKTLPDCNTDCVKVIAYNRGSFWVCPNPFDKTRATALRSQWDAGLFFDREIKSISRVAFEDARNWQS